MSPRPRAKPDIRRKIGVRRERRRILVVAEGTRTEPDYFKGLARAVRATGVSVAVSAHGTGADPERVVAEALRRRDDDGDFDECWAAVDVDDHATLLQAIELAAKAGISLAVSNRCFEIWLLWHFIDHTAFVQDAKDLGPKLKQHGVDGKSLPPRFPFLNYEDATRRARSAAPELAPGVKGPNPSSSVWHLVRKITAEDAPPPS